MSGAEIAAPYHARQFFRLDPWELGDHRLKVYGIALPAGIQRVHESLPAARSYSESVLLPAASDEGHSSRLGFSIIHVGDMGTWLLVHWWAHRDILCQRMAMAAHGEGPVEFRSVDDRPLHGCVWEQVVIHHEREAWVRHMMTPAPNSAAYEKDALPDGEY